MMGNPTGIYRVQHGRMVESTDTRQCASCERPGIVSDWPRNDPANRAARARVLCADAAGHLICDHCAATT